MSNNLEVEAGLAAAQRHGFPTTPVLAEAEAFAAAVTEAVAAVEAETPPDLAAVTIKTIGDAIDAVAAHEITHAARLDAARALARIAADRLAGARRSVVTAHRDRYQAQFNETAAAFTAAVAALGDIPADRIVAEHWNEQFSEVRQYADELTALATVRDFFANTFAKSTMSGHAGYERISRCLILESFDDAVNPPTGMGRGHTRDIAYWVTAAQHPRMEIRWQNPADQDRQPAVAAYARQRAHTA